MAHCLGFSLLMSWSCAVVHPVRQVAHSKGLSDADYSIHSSHGCFLKVYVVLYEGIFIRFPICEYREGLCRETRNYKYLEDIIPHKKNYLSPNSTKVENSDLQELLVVLCSAMHFKALVSSTIHGHWQWTVPRSRPIILKKKVCNYLKETHCRNINVLKYLIIKIISHWGFLL